LADVKQSVPPAGAIGLPRTFGGSLRSWPAVGAACLTLALALVVAMPPSWLPILLGALATLGLAQSRRLGWFGAGLLVLIAIPYGRGADVAPILAGGIPVRPHDAVLAVAIAGSLTTVRRWRVAPDTFVIAVGVWLLVGLVAMAIGLESGNALRDVLRDARWWGLYVVGALAILAGARRDQVLRGLLLGATVLALVVVVATVLPPFAQGMKAMVLDYDRGTLRMQFGNSVLLLVATAYAVSRAATAPSILRVGWVALLAAGQTLSLTRTSILVTVAVVLAVLAFELGARARGRRWAIALRSALMVGVLVAGIASGVALNMLGRVTATGAVNGPGEDPIGRITFSDEQSDISSVVNSVGSGGRLGTYLNALEEIEVSPVIGRGFGALVDVPFAYDPTRAHTIGRQPGVDNAFLTAALKGGAVAAAAFIAMLLLPLLRVVKQRSLRTWYVPASLGVGVLMMTQSFAVSSYGPFAVALVASLPFVGYVATRTSAARDQE
jgi:hypothetical protein